MKSNCLTYKCSKNTIIEVYYKKALPPRCVRMLNKVLCISILMVVSREAKKKKQHARGVGRGVSRVSGNPLNFKTHY